MVSQVSTNWTKYFILQFNSIALINMVVKSYECSTQEDSFLDFAGSQKNWSCLVPRTGVIRIIGSSFGIQEELQLFYSQTYKNLKITFFQSTSVSSLLSVCLSMRKWVSDTFKRAKGSNSEEEQKCKTFLNLILLIIYTFPNGFQ